MSLIFENEIAVIGFSRNGSPLEPAWPSTHRALLPVAGKSLVIHLIEQLADAGIKHVRIAGSIQQFAVMNCLGNGEQWGVKVRYSDLHGPDLAMQTLMEKGESLYFMGDQFIDVKRALELPCPLVSVPYNPDQFDSSGLWTLTQAGAMRVSLGESQFGKESQLKTISDFHRVNQMVATGKVENINLPGRAVKDGVHIGWDSNISSTAIIEAGVTIGNECHIGDSVNLGEGCVIGDGAVLCAGTILENVSVLPNCYVGSAVQLKDAVITPKMIFDLQGNYWRVDDDAIVNRTRSNREEITGLPAEQFSEIENVNYEPAFSQYALNPVSAKQTK